MLLASGELNSNSGSHMEIRLFAFAAFAALICLCVAWGFPRLRQWLRARQGRRAWAKQTTRNERLARAAQAELERERAVDQQEANSWSFERRTWRR